MIRQVLLNNRKNPYFELNQPHDYITIQYEVENKQLYILDLVNNVRIPISEGSDISELSGQIQAIKNIASSAFHFKGKITKQQLDQLSGMNIGDVYQIDKDEYSYNGTEWVLLGPFFDIDEKTQLQQVISGKADKSQIPLSTSQLINNSGYLTEHQSLAGYATTGYVDDSITDLSGTIDSKGYLTEHQSLSAYYNKIEVDEKIPLSTSQLINNSGYLSSTCYPFPDELTDYMLQENRTTQQFCEKFCELGLAVNRRIYLGQIYYLTDMPFDGNAECVISISQEGILNLELYSTNISPYKWSATYWGSMVKPVGAASPWRGELTCPITSLENSTTYIPLQDQDATTKKYVDNKVTNLQNQVNVLSSIVSGLVNVMKNDPSLSTFIDEQMTLNPLQFEQLL